MQQDFVIEHGMQILHMCSPEQERVGLHLALAETVCTRQSLMEAFNLPLNYLACLIGKVIYKEIACNLTCLFLFLPVAASTNIERLQEADLLDLQTKMQTRKLTDAHVLGGQYMSALHLPMQSRM